MNQSMFQPPAVTPFVECPNCKQLLEFGATRCSRCHEEIRPEYALASAYIVYRNTQACSLANTIKSAEPIVVMNIGSSIAGYLLGSPSLFLVSVGSSLLSLSVILVWFFRFGRFGFGDAEFVKARRTMKSSLVLWVTLLLVQVLVFIYLLQR